MLLIALVGCAKKTTFPENGMPAIGVPIADMNTKLQILSPAGFNNTYKNNDPLSLIVKVVTDDQVAFTPDFGARMFIYQNEKWEEVKNTEEYSQDMSQYTIYSNAKDNPFEDGDPILCPSISNLPKTAPLRVIIIGNIYKDGKVTDTKTAGYIDLVLKP